MDGFAALSEDCVREVEVDGDRDYVGGFDVETAAALAEIDVSLCARLWLSRQGKPEHHRASRPTPPLRSLPSGGSAWGSPSQTMEPWWRLATGSSSIRRAPIGPHGLCLAATIQRSSARERPI
jgi:hypothetical protein